MSGPEHRRIWVRGAVQGVGFRPFVYRLAQELNLAGWVTNTPAGVTISVEGPAASVCTFVARLGTEGPPRASIQGMETAVLDPCGVSGFEIRESEHDGRLAAIVLPDIAMCTDCRREILDPANRRFRYPFTNCTNCGPRFSILRSLPYDRANTTMAPFTMCEACRQEYEDPRDRRFHAQPNACAACGPQVEWWDDAGRVGCGAEDALQCAAQALRDGRVVAVKGVGGFHLMTDARNVDCVRRLRDRKRRGAKPFAVMYPDIDAAAADGEISPEERRLLQSPEAPIVLVRRRPEGAVCEAVAPGNPELGMLLPYSPLHQLLMGELGFPVVATSANVSEEPICIAGREAVKRLAGIADAFLVHDRPIERPVDDSVARVVAGRDQVLRRARGYAPLPMAMPGDVDRLLAVGGHLKNTVAVGVGRNLFVSQHIGDLDTMAANDAFLDVVADLPKLYGVVPTRVVCDLHPDYRSTRYAESVGIPRSPVQHHFAHVAAVMVDNDLRPPLHGAAWDGTGYGTDGTVWGGEFVVVNEKGVFRRTGHLLPFHLVGGDAAVREPRRTALSLLAVAGCDREGTAASAAFTDQELSVLSRMLAQGTGVVACTSMGRLFDGMASLLGLCQVNRFEGEAAMALEFAAGEQDTSYPFVWMDGEVLDWRPMLRSVLEDCSSGASVAAIAGKFHSTLADIIVSSARRVGAERMVLSGGCFQNRLLTERAVERLASAGIAAYWPQRIPPGDGGLAVGQAAVAASWNEQESEYVFGGTW